jgi:hypothetical protein
VMQPLLPMDEVTNRTCACGRSYLDDRFTLCPSCDAGRFTGTEAEQVKQMRNEKQAMLAARLAAR